MRENNKTKRKKYLEYNTIGIDTSSGRKKKKRNHLCVTSVYTHTTLKTVGVEFVCMREERKVAGVLGFVFF